MSASDRPAVQGIMDRFGANGVTQDWDDRVFAMMVVENDGGQVVGAATLRWQAECYMALDQSMSRRDRLRAASVLVNEGCRRARAMGVRKLYTPVLDVFSAFGRALRRFRGVRQDDRQQLIISVDERSGCSRSTPDLWRNA